MKKIFLAVIVTLSITLFSCTPENPTTSNNTTSIGPQPKFQFKANGIIQYNDAQFDKRIGYVLYPVIEIKNNELYFSSRQIDNDEPVEVTARFPYNSNVLVTTTLTNPTYLSIRTPNPYFNSSSINLSLENFVFSISRFSNGTADGTFSGTLTTTDNNSSITIAEGTFSNIPVLN
jgi:hypothetical protein